MHRCFVNIVTKGLLSYFSIEHTLLYFCSTTTRTPGDDNVVINGLLRLPKGVLIAGSNFLIKAALYKDKKLHKKEGVCHAVLARFL